MNILQHFVFVVKYHTSAEVRKLAHRNKSRFVMRGSGVQVTLAAPFPKTGQRRNNARKAATEPVWRRGLGMRRVRYRRILWCRRGLEPPLPCENYDLNVARLPIPPSGHGVGRRSDTCRCAGRQRGMQRRGPCRTRKSLPAVSAGPPDAWSAFDLAEIRLPAQDWTTRRPAMIRQAPMAYFTVSGSFRKKAAISGTSTKVRAMKE